MTKGQRIIAELYAPIILKEYGKRHDCQKRVVGARGRWRLVYCRECNLTAIAAAKKISRASTRTESS